MRFLKTLYNVGYDVTIHRMECRAQLLSQFVQ